MSLEVKASRKIGLVSSSRHFELVSRWTGHTSKLLAVKGTFFNNLRDDCCITVILTVIFKSLHNSRLELAHYSALSRISLYLQMQELIIQSLPVSSHFSKFKILLLYLRQR